MLAYLKDASVGSTFWSDGSDSASDGVAFGLSPSIGSYLLSL